MATMMMTGLAARGEDAEDGLQGAAPSILAASSSSPGMAEKNCLNKKML